MKRWLLLGVLALMAAQQTPERRDDKYKDDPHAFCYPGDERGSAHHCECVMVSKQRCTCHAEEPCPGPDPA